MIPNRIRERIENQFGKKVRYPKDCFALAYAITKSCGEKISPSTLMRIFGLTNNQSQPRLYTLDIIAQFCGFTTWESFLEESKNEGLIIEDTLDSGAQVLNNNNILDKIKLSLKIGTKNLLEIDSAMISDEIFNLLNDPVNVFHTHLIIFENIGTQMPGKMIKINLGRLHFNK